MARIHSVSIADETELIRRLRPRDDALIRESAPSELAPSEPGADAIADVAGDLPSEGEQQLVWAEGPFREYSRTVSWTQIADRSSTATSATGSGAPEYRIEQTLRYRLAIPYWAWVYTLPVRRTLPEGLRDGRRPWWSTPDRLSPQQSTMVAAVTLFNMVGGLLYGLLTQVLTFVAADLGDGSRSEQTTLLAVVRVGIVVTMVVMVFADRVGRRRIAIFAFTVSAGLTLITALAPSLLVVGGLQFVSRNLAIAALLCVDTIAVEEMPPGSRAMVVGLGTLAYGLGAGIIVMTLPLADLGDWGWRLTFVVAGLSLPLIWHARRHLPESGRFERLARIRAGGVAGDVVVDDQDSAVLAAVGADLAIESMAPLEATVPADSSMTDSTTATPMESSRVNIGRFVLIATMFFLLNVFLAPSSQLQNDYLRTEVGFSGLMITVFVLATSTPGGLGVLIGGRVADIRGRRAAIIPGLLAIGVFNAIFFSVVGIPMWFASLGGALIGGMAAPALGVIAPELFPTAHRGAVRGAIAAIAVGGSVTGLLVSGVIIDAHGYGVAFTFLAIAPVVGAIVAFLIPETRGRELEDINR